jgi:hypothetical protein
MVWAGPHAALEPAKHQTSSGVQHISCPAATTYRLPFVEAVDEDQAAAGGNQAPEGGLFCHRFTAGVELQAEGGNSRKVDGTRHQHAVVWSKGRTLCSGVYKWHLLPAFSQNTYQMFTYHSEEVGLVFFLGEGRHQAPPAPSGARQAPVTTAAWYRTTHLSGLRALAAELRPLCFPTRLMVSICGPSDAILTTGVENPGEAL